MIRSASSFFRSCNIRIFSSTVSRAINRLSVASGLAYGTVYWAYRGARVTPETAVELAKATAGMVTIDVLVLGPTREAIRNGARKV